MIRPFHLLFLALAIPSDGFGVVGPRSNLIKIETRLQMSMIPPIFKGDEYNRVVENIMKTKGLTREQAEKDYNEYLDNPNNYALNKGEEYYKSLGYKSLMDGVIGEAEKQGRGDEVKKRIEEFKKKSQLKAFGVIGTAIIVFFYYKIQYDLDPSQFGN